MLNKRIYKFLTTSLAACTLQTGAYCTDLEKFDSSLSQTSMTSYTALNQEQLKFFNNNGYVVISNFFDDKQIKTVRSCYQNLQKEVEILAKDQPPSDVETKIVHNNTQYAFKKSLDGKVNVQRYVWAGGSQPQLLQLSRTPQVLNLVKQLFEANQAEQLINQLHPKEPGDQVVFTWHQDVEIRETFDPQWKNINGDRSYVVLSTAIDPANKNNGGLFVVPGSHTDQINYKLKQKNPNDPVFKCYEDQAVAINMNSGDMLLMNQYVVHGSYPNESQDSRLMFLTGYSYPKANHTLYPGQQARQVIDLNTGVLMENKH